MLNFSPLKVNVKGNHQVNFPGEAEAEVKEGEKKRICMNGSLEVSIELQR